jgi:hypothetical protein
VETGKPSALVKNPVWQRRYFTLSDSPFTSVIEYFESEGSNKKGEIRLKSCIVEKTEVNGMLNCFTVKTTGDDKLKKETSYLLSADSEEDREEWMRAIKVIVFVFYLFTEFVM